MKRLAVIQDGKVIDLIMADINEWEHPHGHDLVHHATANIGDVYENGEFIAPAAGALSRGELINYAHYRMNESINGGIEFNGARIPSDSRHREVFAAYVAIGLLAPDSLLIPIGDEVKKFTLNDVLQIHNLINQLIIRNWAAFAAAMEGIKSGEITAAEHIDAIAPWGDSDGV